MKQLLIAAFLCVTAMTSNDVQARCDPGETVLRFSHETNTDRNPKGVTATQLAARVNRDMNGTACMEVYPHGALATDANVLDEMKKGNVEMAAPSLTQLAKVAPAFGVFDMPFLFPGIAAVEQFQASATGQQMRDLLAADGIQGLVYWNAGMKQMSMRETVRTPAQAAKLVLATGSAGPADDHFRTIGVNPTPVAPAGLYDAMGSGQVGALEGTWSNLFVSRSHELHRLAMQTNHGLDGSLVMISGAAWGALKASGRDQLFQILWAVSQERRPLVAEMQRDHRNRILSAGGRVDELTDAERMQWVDALRPSWERGASVVGEKLLAAALVAAGY